MINLAKKLQSSLFNVLQCVFESRNFQYKRSQIPGDAKRDTELLIDL